MTEDEIVEYATHSPENTNPAVLRGMLSQLSGGGSSEPFVVTWDEDQNHTNVTFQELKQALESGRVCYFRAPQNVETGEGGGWYPLAAIEESSDEYDHYASIYFHNTALIWNEQFETDYMHYAD